MRTQDSPFRSSWWGTDLADAGVDVRPWVGTYGNYRFEDLPPLPFAMRGDLDWLARQPVQEEWPIGDALPDELAPLIAACRRDGLTLPSAFVRFMESPSLQRRVRSNTACYVDLDSAPVPSPAGGHLVRFLSDQQGCLYWYLHLVDGGADHAVVCSSAFYGSDTEEDAYDPEEGAEADFEGESDEESDEICFTAESFEAFLCRFWLENEVWFATTDDTPMPDVGAEYIRHYREP